LHPELPRRFIGSAKELEAALSELFPDSGIDMDTLRSRMMKNDDEGGLDLIAEVLAEVQEMKKATTDNAEKEAAEDNSENQVSPHIALERADDECDWKKFIKLLKKFPALSQHIKSCGDVFQWNYRDKKKIDEANQAIIKGLLGEK